MHRTDLRIPKQDPQTAWRLFGAETVLVSPHQHAVRMLNATGSRIWTLADGSRTVEAIAHQLAAEYEVAPAQARQSASAFLEELVVRGIMGWQLPPTEE